jgi:high-affinity iron transporter
VGGTLAALVGLQILSPGSMPDPLAESRFGARVLDIAVLVFREGLECILVLAAVTANLRGGPRSFQRPVAAGAGLAFAASLLTWVAAVRALDALSESMPALHLQAATGLLAILVLLVVMN